jgi:spore coat protein CotH
MEQVSEEALIGELWKEHVATPFPKGFRGKDVDGIDFVMLDADIAGCVDTFLERGNLNLFQTAVLGLCYRHCSYVTLILNEEDATYFWRLERLAELVLKAVALKNEKQHKESR